MKKLYPMLLILLSACTAGSDGDAEPAIVPPPEQTGWMDFAAEAADVEDAAGDGASTRALGSTKITSEKLKTDGNQFGVYSTHAYGMDGMQNNTFDNFPQAVTYNVSTRAWEYSEKKKWKRSDYYRFRAFYPFTADNVSGSDAEKIMINYQVEKDDFDLLVAYAHRCPATDAEGTDLVKLNFKHALSALCFRIQFKTGVPKDAEDHTTTAYLQYLKPAGTLTYEGGDTDSKPEKLIWTANYVESVDKCYEWSGSRIIYAADSGKDAENLYDADGLVFAIPQTIAANTTTFTFTTQNGGADMLHTVYLPEITWEPGKIYIYTLNIAGTKIEVNVSIKEWNKIASNVDIYV